MAETESETINHPDRAPQSELMPGDEGIQNLAREYYAPVYRLALATLRETDASHRATVRTFVFALLEIRNLRAQDSIKIWLFSQALRVIHSEEHRWRGKCEAQTSPETWETQLWQMVDGLGAKEHELCLLHYLLGCRIPETAALLHVSQSAVRAQLDIFRGRFRQILGGTASPSSVEDATSELTNAHPPREQAVKTIQALETKVAGSLQKRWPAPQLSSTELEQVIVLVKQLADREHARRRKTAPYKWLALAAGIVILVAICTSWGILAWLSSTRQIVGASQATAWELDFISPLVRVKALTRSSNTETIRQRLKEGPLLWKTLWIDVQIIAHGPQSYVGLPRIYRAQAWINQPNQSLELFGLLSENPSSESMVDEGMWYYINPTLKVALTEDWEGNPPKEYSGGKLLSNAALRSMVFPGSDDLRSGESKTGAIIVGGIGSTWAEGDGIFKTVKYERIAGRRALVIDWTNPENKREARLWLDMQTGLVLRLQKFGGEDYQTIIYESMVTEIAYNRSNPPPRLYDAFKFNKLDAFLDWADSAMAQDSTLSTPTIAFPLVTRSPIYSEATPIGFDPSHSFLVFQFPFDQGIMNSITNTAEIPSGLIADGYLLEVIKFGLPWVLRCDRSPDGQQLAFNTGTDEIAPADDSLRWFNLKEPQAIYQPLPGLHATSFAFAPDSHRLAIFGFGEGQWERGIYILDIGTGEYELLLKLADARSLVWSPDGEYLALIGSTITDSVPAVMVIHVDTTQIAYQAEIEFLEGVTYTVGPISSWGVKFPVEMGGMDVCAASP